MWLFFFSGGRGLKLKVTSQEGGLSSKMPHNSGEGVSNFFNFKGCHVCMTLTKLYIN